MSFWSQVIGAIHVSYRTNNLNLEFKELEIFLKDYFGETFTYYSSNATKVAKHCKVPYGTEGSLQYSVSDITDYSEHEKRSRFSHFKKEFNLLISFQGDLRDRSLLIDGDFEKWFKSIPKFIDFEDNRIFVEEKLFRVSDDLSDESAYFYWKLGQEE